MRVVVIGTSGAGKSTFAEALARALGCNHVELDALHWAPGWQAVPTDSFRAAVCTVAAGECWVIDGNYSAVREVLWSRATHVVWLDYPRRVVFPRVLWRTLKRGVMRTPLFNGNRESLRMALFSRDSVLLWSFSTFASNRRKFAALWAAPAFAHLQWLQLRRPAQARGVIATLAGECE